MAYLTVDKDNTEWIWWDLKPTDRNETTGCWITTDKQIEDDDEYISRLPEGEIKRITGKQLSWSDEPLYIDLTGFNIVKVEDDEEMELFGLNVSCIQCKEEFTLIPSGIENGADGKQYFKCPFCGMRNVI